MLIWNSRFLIFILKQKFYFNSFPTFFSQEFKIYTEDIFHTFWEINYTRFRLSSFYDAIMQKKYAFYFLQKLTTKHQNHQIILEDTRRSSLSLNTKVHSDQ